MSYKKQISLLLLAAFFALLGYETIAVINARTATPEIFSNALSPDKIEISLSQISNNRLQSLLQVEDPNFYQHNGIDLVTAGAGLTTITQGMVKYLYFDNFEPGFAKIEQTLIACFAVTPMVSKDDQLTVFINTAYFGTVNNKKVTGFPAASMTYFEKPLTEISDTEFLSLVAMLIGPDHYSIKYHPERNQARVTKIMRLLSGEYVPTGVTDVLYDH